MIAKKMTQKTKITFFFVAFVLFVTLTSAAVDEELLSQWLGAAVKGDVTKLGRLLDEDQSLLDAQDAKTGRTAAIEAALNGQTKAIEFLLERGADVASKIETKGGFSAMDAASEGGHVDVVKLLLNHVNPNEETQKDGLRPIHRAAVGTTTGHLETLKVLLESDKVSANDISRENMTPLAHALRMMRPTQFKEASKLSESVTKIKRDMARVLLSKGANAGELSDDEIMKLQLTFREIEDFKKRPVSKRKIPDFRIAYKSDQLMLEAVQRQDWEWVEHEVKQNLANVNAKQTQNGQTAFMTACLKGDVHTAKKLHELGADPSIPESSGYTPFHGAGYQGHANIAQFLMDELGLDPNHMHKDGFRPIHRACWGKQLRHTEFVRYLLSTGKVDVDSPTAKGLTPLQVVLSNDAYKNGETAKVLVMYGADVSKVKEEDLEALALVSDDDFQTCPAFVGKDRVSSKVA